MLLDWLKWFSIIKVVARRLLYLHKDSRLAITDRDLKAGNILLGANMKPKIADFDTRTFDETRKMQIPNELWNIMSNLVNN